MKHLVPELNQIQASIVVIAPQRAGLVSLMERLCVELTTELLAPQQQAHLANWSKQTRPQTPGTGGITTWTSFTLGQRSGCDARVNLLGFDLEHSFPSKAVFEMADGLILYNAESSKRSEAFLASKPDLSLQNKPLLVVHRNVPDSERDLREKAVQLWASRHFLNCQHVNEGSGLLAKAMDWIFHF